jgi:hypothetical protein
MEQSAVEWLELQLNSKSIITKSLFKQAKEMGNQQQDKFAIDFFNWCNSEDAEDLLHDLIMVGEVDKNVTIEQILEIYKNK